MRQMWAVAVLQMRLVARSKAMLAVMLAMPLLFTFLIGMLLGGSAGAPAGHTYPVAVVDQDNSFLSQRLIESLQGEKALQVRLVPGGNLTKLFADKRIDSGLVIPAGFQRAVAAGAGSEVQLVAPPGGNLQVGVSPVVRRIVSQVAQDYRLALQVAGSAAAPSTGAVPSTGAAPSPAASTTIATAAAQPDTDAVHQAYTRVSAERRSESVTVSRETVQRAAGGQPQSGTSLGEYSLGFTVTFVMMMLFTMAGSILRERQTGTWGRLLATPSSRASLISGYLLSFFFTGMLQFALLMGISTLLFRIQWGPLLPLFTLVAAFVLCSAGMGLFLAGIVRTPEQQGAIGTLFVTATSMLGGVYWPLDFVGSTMRRIGYLTPQAWAMDGFREVVLRGGSWSGLVWPLTVLLLYTLIFMTAGLFRVRHE